MSELKSQFGKRLKVMRAKGHLTQEDLAKATNLSTSFISSLERGIDAPSFGTLDRIAEALNISVKELFDFESGFDQDPQPDLTE